MFLNVWEHFLGSFKSPPMLHVVLANAKVAERMPQGSLKGLETAETCLECVQRVFQCAYRVLKGTGVQRACKIAYIVLKTIQG